MLNQTLQQHCIVICNDNQQETVAIVEAFEKASVAKLTVYTAESGQSFLYLMERLIDNSQFPSVIVLDFLLGDSNASSVLPKLRKHYPPIPIVVIGSCLGSEEDITALYRQGVNAYMVKPQTTTEYMELVAHIEKLWMDVPQPRWGERQKIRNVNRQYYGRRGSDN